MTSLHIQGHFYFDKNVQSPYDGTDIMLAVVYDKQPSTAGTLPLSSDIFQDLDNNGATNTDSDSHMNMNNRDRFYVLWRMRKRLPITVNQAGAGTAVPVSSEVFPSGFCRFDKYIRLKKLETIYKGTQSGGAAPLQSDIASGALYILCLQDNTVFPWRIEFNARLKYWDI